MRPAIGSPRIFSLVDFGIFIVLGALLIIVLARLGDGMGCAPIIATAEAAESPAAALLAVAENQSEVSRANANGVIIAAFSMHGCPHCEANEPYVRTFAMTNGWTFAYINAKDPRVLPFLTQYGINAVPVYLVFSRGELIDTVMTDSAYRESAAEAQRRINERFGRTARLVPHY